MTCRPRVDAAAPALRTTRPTLLTVRFDAAHHGRPDPFIQHAADEFAAWRRRDESAMARPRLAAEQGLRAALAAIPAGPGRWAAVAERLNTTRTKTIRGGRWTPENVRKLAGRINEHPTSPP